MTASRADELIARYQELLSAYIDHAGESLLNSAYEIGREAFAAGIGMLEMIEAHVAALDRIAAESARRESPIEVMKQGHPVLLECLAQYELAYRGFRDANQELVKAHRKQNFLVTAMARFSASLDQKETVREIILQAVESLAVACLVELDDGAPGAHVVYCGRRGESREDIVELKHDPAEPECLLRQKAAIKRSPRWPDHVQVVRPLATQRVKLGGVAFIHRDRHAWDYPLLDEFALRASTALDNAKLYQGAIQAIRAREDMLRIVSHDLKNPLATIGLSADYIQRMNPQQMDPVKIKAHATRIRSGVRQMDTLVEDILDLAKIETGNLPVAPVPFQVKDLVSEAVALMGPLAQRSGIELTSELLCPEARVCADPARMFQVFSNLIGNALKFTPAGRKVTLRAKRLERAVLFSVSDTGEGIAPESLPYVFDRLWQASPSTRAGIGFGLFISKSIIEAHGGEICPDSRPGVGSTFYFTLPLAAAEKKEREAA